MRYAIKMISENMFESKNVRIVHFIQQTRKFAHYFPKISFKISRNTSNGPYDNSSCPQHQENP